MLFYLHFLSVVACLAQLNGAYAGFDPASASNVVVYWGQNSYGQGTGSLAQQRLVEYCANSNIDVIPLAFVIQVNGQGGQPSINFANAGDNCTTFEGTTLLNCPQLEEDIAACQTQYSKIVMLSIGGATYSEGGFQSEDAAIAGARKVWETFGPPQEGSDALRPFGKSSVDGFDFDFEATVSNMVPFGNELRTLMDDAGSSSGKKYFLSAAPQCPYPDAANNEMLDGAVAFDVIWVQFYNNFCGLQNFHPGQDPQSAFNFDVWDTWAKNTSKNKDVKVMLGVPAGQTAAGSGYLPPDSLKPVIDYCKKFASFGGVMMWDASQAVANSGFLEGIKGALDVAAAVRTAQVPMA